MLVYRCQGTHTGRLILFPMGAIPGLLYLQQGPPPPFLESHHTSKDSWTGVIQSYTTSSGKLWKHHRMLTKTGSKSTGKARKIY